jgi:predicted metal-dependent hydrolase
LDHDLQLALPFGARQRPAGPEPGRDLIVIGRQAWTVTYVRHRRARHYVLRLEDDGSVRVTIPRGGSRKDAERFAKHKAPWIERERYRRTMVRGAAGGWRDGGRILLRGEDVLLLVDRETGVVRFGPEAIPLPTVVAPDLRGLVAGHLRRLAEKELPPRLVELAAASGHHVTRVTVRDQRSRWGSCSASGRISLNWRLIQVPASVRDYVLLHELTHLQEANHSARFWKKLEAVCPWHREAREWLRTRFSGTMSDPWSPSTPKPADAARPIELARPS